MIQQWAVETKSQSKQADTYYTRLNHNSQNTLVGRYIRIYVNFDVAVAPKKSGKNWEDPLPANDIVKKKKRKQVK